MKQIEATILGQSYALTCPPGGEHLLREAVAIVDREMSAIRDAGKVKARERMAVLAALNLAYQRAEQAEATPSTASTGPGTEKGAEHFDVEHLIARIDAALGGDGHLI